MPMPQQPDFLDALEERFAATERQMASVTAHLIAVIRVLVERGSLTEEQIAAAVTSLTEGAG